MWSTPEETTAGLLKFCHRWIQVIALSLKGFAEHREPTNASALTFTTLFTAVPSLAILVAVLTGIGKHEIVFTFIRDLPIVEELGEATIQAGGDSINSVAQAINTVEMYVEKTSKGGLGLIGLAFLVLAVVSVLHRIEGAMNHVWGIRRRRAVPRMLSDYLSLCFILVVLLIGFSAATGGSILSFLPEFEGLYLDHLTQFLTSLVPFLLVCLALTCIYYVIPNTRVQWWPATVAGVLAGALLWAAQRLFIELQFLLQNINYIYGAFAGVMLLLMWIYISWGIVLWGAEMCSARQNLTDWRRRRRVWRATPFERETLALRLAALLAAPLIAGPGTRRSGLIELADRLRVPVGPIEETLALFHENGLIVQSGDDQSYLLACSPEEVNVLDVLRVVRQGRLGEADEPQGPVQEFTAPLTQSLQTRSLKDIATLPIDQIQSFTL